MNLPLPIYAYTDAPSSYIPSSWRRCGRSCHMQWCYVMQGRLNVVPQQGAVFHHYNLCLVYQSQVHCLTNDWSLKRHTIQARRVSRLFIEQGLLCVYIPSVCLILHEITAWDLSGFILLYLHKVNESNTGDSEDMEIWLCSRQLNGQALICSEIKLTQVPKLPNFWTFVLAVTNYSNAGYIHPSHIKKSV